jgi:hypothetical protein
MSVTVICDAGHEAEGVAKAVAILRVHPAIDDWIVAARAHRQPIAGDPHGSHPIIEPDERMVVCYYGDDV